MSGRRRLFLDASPGEIRAVVTLDGLPERLLIERPGQERGPRLGALYRVRIDELAAVMGMAFVELGGGEAGIVKASGGAGLKRGAILQATVTAEARADKAATLRIVGPSEGKPALLEAAPDIELRLAAFAPGAPVVRGPDAREAADEAEDAVLAERHALADGLVLTIEPTRALVAIDVDLSPASARARRLAANMDAVRHAARLLRLKALGGTVAIDLIGGGQDDSQLREAARSAFQPDQPGVSVLPVSRLGVLQVARPHRERPARELLCDEDGRLSARSVAQKLLRALEREGRFAPGVLLQAFCSQETAAALRPLVAALGPRFSVKEELGWDRLKTDIRQP